MKARLNSASLCVTITLLSALVGGCGPLGGDNTSNNVQPSPQPVASPAFPKPTVPSAVKSPAKIALTRPTNPDDRLRVIKSGRNDPFLKLADSKGTDGKDDKSKNEAKPKEKLTPQEKYLKHATSSYDRFLDKVSEAYVKPNQNKGSGSSSSIASSSSIGSSGGINLPSLPSKPDLAAVKVTGVVEIAGMPRAIVEAPDEKTSRTVGIGDSLSGGKLYVKNIDLSNRAEPMVIFQQGNTQFSVAVGREPVLIASAPTGSGNPLRPVKGLYSTRVR